MMTSLGMKLFTDYKFTPRQIELMKFFTYVMSAMMLEMIILKLLKQKNASDGVFPHWFRADDHDNFDGDNYDDGSDFMVHEEYEADQYTSIGKKGSTKNGANGRNPEDCNFSWLAGSVPRWSPINGVYRNLKLKNYHLHNGMLLFRKNVNRSC